MQRGFSIIMLLVIILVIVLVGAGAAYFFLFNSPEPELAVVPPPTFQTTPSPMSEELPARATSTPSPTQTLTTDLTECLPAGTQLTDHVIHTNDPNVTTVEQALRRLQPNCNTGGLPLTAQGRKILFYRLGGCYGMSPQRIEELVQASADRVSQLKKEYEVIEQACKPETLP